MRVLQKFHRRIELKGKLHFDAKNLIYMHHFFMSNLKPLCELIFKYAPTFFHCKVAGSLLGGICPDSGIPLFQKVTGSLSSGSQAPLLIMHGCAHPIPTPPADFSGSGCSKAL